MISEHKQHESKESKNAYLRDWRKQNKEKCKEHYLKYREKGREGAWRRRYGITREDYNLMLENQNYTCAICHTTDVGRGHTHFHVDHNHDTGEVRGLLCDKCNRGLGYFNDNIKTITNAIKYLENTKNEC